MEKRKTNWLLTGSALGILGEVGVGVVLVTRVLETPVNHVGVSPYVGLVWLIPCTLLGVWAALRGTYAGRALVYLSLMLGGLLVIFDQCNILVEYETWLDRGMPGRPTWVDCAISKL